MKKTILAGLLAAAANLATAGTVLVVVSDQDKLDLKDGKVMQTGFFLNELMEPVQAFIAAGHTVVFATPSGKAPSADQKSDDVNFWGGNEKARQESKALLATLKLTAKAGSPAISLAQVKRIGYDKFDAVFVPGGHIPMQDLLKNKDLGELLTSFHNNGKVTGLTCHGTIALLSTIPDARGYVGKLESGQRPQPAQWIYTGYKMTAFTNEEEEQAKGYLNGGQMKLFPQDGLVAAGGNFVEAKAWSENVVEDRELISGQNPQSAKAVALAMLKKLH
ncbi:thiamine biosynthesis protein ThiJ [Massilia sp. Root418]|jgi:putative intracellular protease/amidase|uniref:type 1 glutamine amidotransferase domain-containing protein n=1 Tax=Massilia sp. Root418 TaxID=1736532 RepID=UPI0006F206A8|nr:type 1 glutamine amidotransferase domain-containing protein [Massilia sp. Root418]KQW87805.1 thiamine biosynthesis protein ThiJ [Massilia sp. Root418]